MVLLCNFWYLYLHLFYIFILTVCTVLTVSYCSYSRIYTWVINVFNFIDPILIDIMLLWYWIYYLALKLRFPMRDNDPRSRPKNAIWLLQDQSDRVRKGDCGCLSCKGNCSNSLLLSLLLQSYVHCYFILLYNLSTSNLLARFILFHSYPKH